MQAALHKVNPSLPPLPSSRRTALSAGHDRHAAGDPRALRQRQGGPLESRTATSTGARFGAGAIRRGDARSRAPHLEPALWIEATGLTETPALLMRFCMEAGREIDPKFYLTVRNTEEAWHVECFDRVAEAFGGRMTERRPTVPTRARSIAICTAAS